jgi:hypothetical protein
MKNKSLIAKSFAIMTMVSMTFMVGCSKEPILNPNEKAEIMNSSSQTIKNVPKVAGRTIQNIDVQLINPQTQQVSQFAGRIVNLNVERVGNEILASGRLIGALTQNGITQQINRVFENVPLNVLDELLNIIDLNQNQQVCPIVFLELGPIFLDVLGLIVEVPDPIVVDVRAERGPGKLLGNLLCALVGILD